MMSSQRDMFLSSQESSQESSENVSSSLPASVTYTYLWVILFDWDENIEFPFNLYQVALFSKKELKKKWISGDLNQSSRVKKLSFSAIRGKTFSLFGKVEKCMIFHVYYLMELLFTKPHHFKYYSHRFQEAGRNCQRVEPTIFGFDNQLQHLRGLFQDCLCQAIPGPFMFCVRLDICPFKTSRPGK